jgi:hypothetical protein
MAAPSQPERCNNATIVQTQTIGADNALAKIAKTLDHLQAENGQANCSNTNTAAPLLKAKSIDDPAVDENAKKVKFKIAEESNSVKFKKFTEEWGRRAVASGQISSRFFNTYQFILGLPPPADNISKADFEKKISDTAGLIWNWYANAQYAGDLGALGNAILASKPSYTEPTKEGFIEHMCSGSRGFSLREAAIFAGIVGAGLTGIWLWNAVAGGRGRRV